jgi:hypothetical protein
MPSKFHVYLIADNLKQVFTGLQRQIEMDKIYMLVMKCIQHQGIKDI